MISITTIDVQENNKIIIREDPRSTLKMNTARVTLIPTLDGGAVSIHGGVTDVDKAPIIKSNITKEQEAILWEMFENNLYLLMAVNSTLYTISIKKLKTDQGKLEMSILITNKEN